MSNYRFNDGNLKVWGPVENEVQEVELTKEEVIVLIKVMQAYLLSIEGEA